MGCSSGDAKQMGGRAWKLKAAEAVSKPRQSKRNPVGKVSLNGAGAGRAGAGRAVATSFFFFRDGTTATARKLKKSHWLI
jgi:hypothetical protein